MAYDPQQYAAMQAANPSNGWLNRCQQFVRTALGFSAGVPGGGSAREEYNYTKAAGNIVTTGTAPANVPVYFDTKGSSGHVALSAGGGYAWTTDMAGPGTVSLQKISDIAGWAGPYLGYGESEGNTQLTETGGLSDKAKAALKVLTGQGLIGYATGEGEKQLNGVTAGAAGAAASATADAVVSGFKSIFTAELVKRALAAIAGILLILMTVYRLSGMTAVPIPV